MGKINGIMNVAFLSTYPPRECGLATFTEDLVSEIAKITLVRPYVIPVTNGDDEYTDPLIGCKLIQHERQSYLDTAKWANNYVDLLVIQHEYGIFGGKSGEYIIDLVKNLQIPFIVTAHTILEKPTIKQRDILQKVGQLCSKFITMAESCIPILVSVYGIDPAKIAFIPHGVPSILVGAREKLKANHGVVGKQVVSSFGLLSPAKGLEYGIQAMAKVVADFPDVVYMILGKTHPCVQQVSGEKYRQSLRDLAEKLGIKKNVLFVDKYLTKEEVIRYLNLSDVYLTPYLSREQAVSGTLAYAVGCGRVVVSTPYRYAQEMLGGGRGMLANFKDANSLAVCLKHILHNPALKREMERKTMLLGQTMTWDNVAIQYTQLMVQIMEKFHPDGAMVG